MSSGMKDLIDIRAWTDDLEMTRDEDWRTFARLYPFASAWLQDVEASNSAEIRTLVRTGRWTRLRHLGHVEDDYFGDLVSLCGVSARGIGSELMGETCMRLDKPYRICPKCKTIAKGGRMTKQAPKRGRGRPAPTWKDWAGRLPADYMGAERTRHTRTRTFPRTMHIMHAPYGAPCCTWDSPEPGEMLTICGVEVCDYEDRESWCTEAMKEDSPVIAAPFPDDVKMCRICNARVRKIKDAEPPAARGAEQPAIPSEEGPADSQAPKRGRGRPVLGEGLKRSRVVKLYMRPEELAELSSRAEARGLSVSEYLRRRALGLRLPTE